jgi:uncharacterized Tic20 family protein
MSTPIIPPIANPLASGPIVESDPAQRTQAMIANLLGIFGILGTGIFYLIKKNDPTAGPFVRDQIKEAFNFQCAIFVAYIVLMIAMIVLGMISSILALLVSLVVMVASLGVIAIVIINALKANKGEAARYPFKIAVLK